MIDRYHHHQLLTIIITLLLRHHQNTHTHVPHMHTFPSTSEENVADTPHNLFIHIFFFNFYFNFQM